MTFLHNKYSKWYFNIIEKRRTFSYDGYTEKHHIIPRCLGGTDIQNTVRLTAKEHFVCHHLLTKMMTGKDWFNVVFAFNFMRVKSSNHQRNFLISSRTYKTIKEMLSKTMSENRRGKLHSEESKKKMSLIKLQMSNETKKKMSIAQTGKIIPESVKKKISASTLGRQLEEDHCLKISDSLKAFHASKTKIYKCEHCDKETSLKTNFIRWHGEKCKHLRS